MKKSLILICILFLIIMVSLKSSLACTCDLQLKNKSVSKQIKEAYKKSTVVFIGEVLEITKIPNTLTLKIKFRVYKSWKNSLPNEIPMTTGLGDGDCSFRFQSKEKYIVYADGSISDLGTNICSRTSPITENQDSPILNKIYKRKN